MPQASQTEGIMKVQISHLAFVDLIRNTIKIIVFWLLFSPALLHFDRPSLLRIISLYRSFGRLGGSFDTKRDILFESGRQTINAARLTKRGVAEEFPSHIDRTSDTLYIMGSGPSINELTERELSQIQANDSMAFNWFIVHDLVPTFYVLQPPILDCWNVDTLGRHQMGLILKRKSHALSSTKVILKGGFLSKYSGTGVKYLEWLKDGLKSSEPFAITPRINVAFRARDALLSFLNSAKKSALIGFDTGLKSPVLQINSTLNFCLTLSAQFGYRKVVLCGFDSENPGHFFDRRDYKERFPELDKRKSGVSDLIESSPHVGTGHATMLAQEGFMSPNECTIVICQFLANEFGMEVEVQDRSSFFSGHFREHKWIKTT